MSNNFWEQVKLKTENIKMNKSFSNTAVNCHISNIFIHDLY